MTDFDADHAARFFRSLAAAPKTRAAGLALLAEIDRLRDAIADALDVHRLKDETIRQLGDRLAAASAALTQAAERRARG